MVSVKHNWIKKRENSDLLYKNFNFNQFDITNEEFNQLSGDTKYKYHQKLLKKLNKLGKKKSRTADMKKEKILWAMQFLKYSINRWEN